MDNALTLMRKVRLYFKSGASRDLMLTESEILNISTAVSKQDELSKKGITCFTIMYDSDLDEHHRKLSFLIVLNEVGGLDIGDVEYTLDELKNINMDQFNIWKAEKTRKPFVKVKKHKGSTKIKRKIKKSLPKSKKHKSFGIFLKASNRFLNSRRK